MENLLPQNVGSIINYLQLFTKIAHWELLDAVDHNQLQTTASETVDPIDWSHPHPTQGAVPLSPTYCTVQFALQVTRLAALSEPRTCDLRNTRPTWVACAPLRVCYCVWFTIVIWDFGVEVVGSLIFSPCLVTEQDDAGVSVGCIRERWIWSYGPFCQPKFECDCWELLVFLVVWSETVLNLPYRLRMCVPPSSLWVTLIAIISRVVGFPYHKSSWCGSPLTSWLLQVV